MVPSLVFVLSRELKRSDAKRLGEQVKKLERELQTAQQKLKILSTSPTSSSSSGSIDAGACKER